MRVVLGVSGGIAAYKAAEVVRGLVERGATVRVLMTPNATRFITPLTLGVLSGSPVVADLWDPSSGAVDHVDLARETDILAIAPATADILAKLAAGIADDVLSTYALAHRTALLVAPAMNTWMWSHPATQANLETLRRRGAVVVPPDSGDLACGDVGPGRLAQPAAIVEAILDEGRMATDLAGTKVLVTAGPTREPLDPVRYLSNRSSGKMGFAIAREAVRRGAEVVLVCGPVALAPPPGVRVVRVERTVEMRDAVLSELPAHDVLVMAAAPADFTVDGPAERKIKRSAGAPELTLVAAPDILRAVAGTRRPGQIVVAFAAETDDLLANARQKLLAKGADLLVANDVSRAGTGFDSDENEVQILEKAREEPELVPRTSKTLVARRLLDRVAALLAKRGREGI